MQMWHSIQEPEDGWTQHERLIMRDLVISMYRVVGDTTDRFILVMACECGYTQADIARILNISQAAVSKRLHNVLTKIREKRKNGRL